MGDPNVIDWAWQQFRDGELSLDGLGQVLIDNGFSPKHVRKTLSDEIGYAIPVNYFGGENES